MEMVLAFLNADLRNVGPTKQTLNIICCSGIKDSVVVFTLFDEPEKTLLPEYLVRNIKVVCLYLNRKTFFLKGSRILKEALQKHHVTHLHSFGVKPDILAHSVCRKLDIRHIITLRNFPMEDVPTRMHPMMGFFTAIIHLNVLKRCRYLISCSKTIAKKMELAYHLENRITPIQNGVDTTIYTTPDSDAKRVLRAKLGLSLGKYIFISTNSFIPRKHNDEIISAFVSANLPKAELLMLGEGFLLKELKTKYKQNSSIKYTGLVMNILEYLQCADCFISASDSEGLPNAVLEAMACNLPIILSDIPQHREILDELPECGKIFPLHNIEQLSLMMQEYANKEKQNVNIAKALKKTPFTMEEMGRRYKIYYKEMGVPC